MSSGHRDHWRPAANVQECSQRELTNENLAQPERLLLVHVHLGIPGLCPDVVEHIHSTVTPIALHGNPT